MFRVFSAGQGIQVLGQGAKMGRTCVSNLASHLGQGLGLGFRFGGA